MTNLNVVTIPCFSGAAWDLAEFKPLAHRPLQTMRLPEAIDSVEAYADFVLAQVTNLDSYILIGDSFGAVVTIAAAVRQPKGLRGIVLSGGFATSPVTSPIIKAKVAVSRYLKGVLYREITLRFHTDSLVSPYDETGEVAWTKAQIRQFFIENTPQASYTARVSAAFRAHYVDKLHRINVPALILTPSYDKLIGEHAAKQLLDGIADAQEQVIENSGHMFRFTHPITYGTLIERFIQTRIVA